MCDTSDEWVTVSFSPLPLGWVNVYKDDQGNTREDACPGVLMQEHRFQILEYDDGHVTSGPCEKPYATRTEFADASEGWIDVVSGDPTYQTTYFNPGSEAFKGTGEGA